MTKSPVEAPRWRWRGKTYKSVVKLVDVKVSIKTVVLEREEEGYRVEGEHLYLSLIHISEPTRLGMISYAVFCLKK